MLGNTQTTVIRSTKSTPAARRGFSLIEIMIVMIILITLIAIFVPVLAGARNASRSFATKQLFTGLQTASSQYELDQRRLPGYFTQAQMGSTENGSPGSAGRGFTQMQNLLLDLSGGVASTGTTIDVGPMNAGFARVDVTLINAPLETKGIVKNVYYNVDRKNWTSQDGPSQKAAAQANKTLPDLLDSWSNPVIAWVEDETVSVSAPFAALDSTPRPKFNWAGNAAFLNSSAFGRAAKDQTKESLLNLNTSTGGPTSFDIAKTMAGLLGHPSFPVTNVIPMPNPPVPASSRSKVVFHSAGADGVFLGTKDRGGLVATATGAAGSGHMTNVVDYKGSKGDPLDLFDDVVTVGGN